MGIQKYPCILLSALANKTVRLRSTIGGEGGGPLDPMKSLCISSHVLGLVFLPPDYWNHNPLFGRGYILNFRKQCM